MVIATSFNVRALSPGESEAQRHLPRFLLISIFCDLMLGQSESLESNIELRKLSELCRGHQIHSLEACQHSVLPDSTTLRPPPSRTFQLTCGINCLRGRPICQLQHSWGPSTFFKVSAAPKISS